MSTKSSAAMGSRRYPDGMNWHAQHRFATDHPALHTPAIWHPSPDASRRGYTVVLFRRRFRLKERVQHPVVWFSAAQHANLFLDGVLVARGPSRTDPERWGCVRVTLPTLAAGRHVLAARVWHLGKDAGIGQMGNDAFFLLCAESHRDTLASLMDTGAAWRCCHDRSRSPLRKHAWGPQVPHDVVGSGEEIRGADTPWGWENLTYRDTAWPRADQVCTAVANPWGNRPLNHFLRPDPLPQMTEINRQPQCLVPGHGTTPPTIPPRTTTHLIFDAGELVNAYPTLTLSGGADATIDLVTAEAPYHAVEFRKLRRDCIEHARLLGHLDRVLPDGGRRRTYTTLWFRSFRYLELRITTGEAPLTVDAVGLRTTGYPLAMRATFQPTGRAAADYRRAWAISRRTAQLCAHETFFDCPHYEQGQFPGDTRVQAVYHYLIANDDRLARKAIDDFHASRNTEGLILSHYPSTRYQVIPTFALHWVGMLDDFLTYRGEPAFLSPYLPAARGVLHWFTQRRRPDGLLGLIGHAPFTDWTAGFYAGNAPQDADGGSSILTSLLAQACDWMTRLEQAAGFPELASRWRHTAAELKLAVRTQCWDPHRKIFADTPMRRTFSVHAQTEATLAGILPRRQAGVVLGRALDAPDVTQPGSFYYRYHVCRALRRCGLHDRIIDMFRLWFDCAANTGLSTWPETQGDNPRSDCHGWSVTPAIEFIHTVLGIEPAPDSIGFAEATVTPHPGPLTSVRGSIETPTGRIRVTLDTRATDTAPRIESTVKRKT